jgi:hypothetical protein
MFATFFCNGILFGNSNARVTEPMGRIAGMAAVIGAPAMALAMLLLAAPAGSQETVDLKLVLAVDASGSVDTQEYDLQLSGIAMALRDPAVLKAIAAGRNGRIAINVVTWAEHQVPKVALGWHIVANAADAGNLAAAIENMGRTANGATGMGEGLAAALRLLEDPAIMAPREVVDISGDGAETPARDYVVLMPQARSMAMARGVTVNGLAILGSEMGLAEWYQANVLTGRDSFLEIATGYESVAKAMKRKLLREIEPLPRLSQR